MANYRQFLQHVLCLAGLLIAGSAQAGTDDELLAGPAYATPIARSAGGPCWQEQSSSAPHTTIEALKGDARRNVLRAGNVPAKDFVTANLVRDFGDRSR